MFFGGRRIFRLSLAALSCLAVVVALGCNPSGMGDGTDNTNQNEDPGQDLPNDNESPDNSNGGNDNTGNDNTGDNTNDNTGDNANDNTGDNTNDNTGGNTNDNGNDNTNGNDNSVDNGNDNSGTMDDDGDGVPNDIDECPSTVRGAQVDEVGCAISGGGGGGGGGGGTTAVCGNGVIEQGEECDPPNGTSCDDDCLRIVGGGVDNDNCDSPAEISDGTFTFSTIGATTDGRDEPNRCVASDTSLIENDIWFCYTAPCTTSNAVISLCGSNYDTMLSVYDGCECPGVDALRCSDDDCGSTYLASRLTTSMVEGRQYLIRIGGYQGATGDGFLHIACDQEIGCPTNATGDCYAAHDTPGCDDADCCEAICGGPDAVDRYCCDVQWDDRCAQEAAGICGGLFEACDGGTGGCSDAHGGLGCSDQSCCQAVCQTDPICCLDGWDDLCATSATDLCGVLDVCAGASGDCATANGTPGCADQECCESVCIQDEFCCTTEWDESCVEIAQDIDVCRD